MSSIKSDKNTRKPFINTNTYRIMNTPSGDSVQDPKPATSNNIEITESGDNTLYVTCTEFDANKTFIESSADETKTETILKNKTIEESILDNKIIEESILDSTLTESSSGGSITNSSLDETLAESNSGDTIGETYLNSTFRNSTFEEHLHISYLEESLEDIKNEYDNIIHNNNLKCNRYKYDCDATDYFSLDSSATNTPQSPPDIAIVNEPTPKNDKMFTEYRDIKDPFLTDTSSSFVQDESNLDESWLYDGGMEPKKQEEVEEIQILMKELKLSNEMASQDLRDEKDLSLEHVEKMHQNAGDEYGPDVDTTNLLILARQSLETYADVEERYIQREKRLRSIVQRRFHVTLEEFFDAVAEGIGKKEGLDRYEVFLEQVELAISHRDRCDKIKKNLVKFDKLEDLKNIRRPIKTYREKQAYFLKTLFPAIYMYAAKVNKAFSQKRGYASV